MTETVKIEIDRRHLNNELFSQIKGKGAFATFFDLLSVPPSLRTLPYTGLFILLVFSFASEGTLKLLLTLLTLSYVTILTGVGIVMWTLSKYRTHINSVIAQAGVTTLLPGRKYAITVGGDITKSTSMIMFSNIVKFSEKLSKDPIKTKRSFAMANSTLSLVFLFAVTQFLSQSVSGVVYSQMMVLAFTMATYMFAVYRYQRKILQSLDHLDKVLETLEKRHVNSTEAKEAQA